MRRLLGTSTQKHYQECVIVAKLQDFNPIKYDQGEQIEKALGDAIAQRSDVSGGICFSLCCQWMELHRKYHKMGGGEKDRIAAMALRIKALMSDSVYFYRAMNSQAGDYAQTYADKLEQKNETGRKYGLVFSSEQTNQKLAMLAASVNGTHSYTQTSFGLGQIGRHAICAYKSGGKFLGFGSHLYVFDPNYGEYRVSQSKIEEFYRTLFSSYAKGRKGYINEIVTYQVEVKS